MLARHTVLLLIVALSLAACGGKKPPATPVMPSPAPTLVATFTATPPAGAVAGATTAAPVRDAATAMPSPSAAPMSTAQPTAVAPTLAPTATLPVTATLATTATLAAGAPAAPSARLALGRYLQSIGDCAAARREFAAIAADSSVPADAAEARYRLGLCYLRDDAAAEAATVLAELVATAPITNTHRIPATFLLGEALAGQGRWAEAETSYAAYLPLAPELNTLTWQRIGAARKAAGDPLRAAEAYSTALRTSPDWESTVAIRRTLADLALARKDIPAAVAQYDLLRSASTSPAWIAQMQWLAGAALASAGDPATPPDAAKQRWQAAVDADPTTSYAHQALAALVAAGVPVDEYQRGLVNYFNGKYALANAAFDRLRAADPTGRKGDAWYYAGLSYLKQGQTERGLAELGNLIAAYPDNAHWTDAWLAQADARAQAGDLAGAIAAYRQFAGQRPDAPQASTALWRAANWQEETGDTGGAAEAFRALARKYPAADEGWRAAQAAGLIYFRAGNWQRAAETWREMADAGMEPFTKPVANFWLGRAQAAAGDIEAAKQSWQKAVQADPASYYGLRAAAWLAKSANQQITPTPTPDARASSAKPDDRAELSAWLKSWAGEGTLALPAAVTSDADWRRGQALLDLGRRADGLAAWGRVQAKYAQQPWTLAALALAFRDAGANRLSILSAEQLLALSAPLSAPLSRAARSARPHRSNGWPIRCRSASSCARMPANKGLIRCWWRR